jgi:ABC-type spermidine/putrescine transport system permease subunit II
MTPEYKEDLFLRVVVFIIVFIFISAPIRVVCSLINSQKILQEQCGMSVSFWEVATNKDDLMKICQINNQSLKVQIKD